MRKIVVIFSFTLIFMHSLPGQALGPQPIAFHTGALHADGSVYTWGSNDDGQLGDNSTTQRNTPVKVLRGAYSGTTYLGDDPSNKIIAIASGYIHSIALAADGSVYTWGDNFSGKLGNNSITDSYIPVKVLKGEYSGTTYLGDNSSNKIIAIALGYYHSIALAADGSVYTWGYNGYGQLGDNSTTEKHTPVKVKGVGGEGDLSLPVELTDFTAKYQSGVVILSWTTESETENLGFIIEKRLQVSGDWLPVADYRTDKALQGHGSTSEKHEYQFTDKAVQPGATYIYRLADVDYSGKVTWHKEVEVKVEAEAEDRLLPMQFGLQKIYPNPFNPSLTLTFSLVEDALTTLTVYNLRGEIVDLIADKYFPMGHHSLQWIPQNLTAGVYIIRLESGNQTSLQKVVFLK